MKFWYIIEIEKIGEMYMKNKGFSLVELLASITILGIIMGIAVPAFSGMLVKNKKQTMINDAKKFISLVEAQAKSDNYTKKYYRLNCEDCSSDVLCGGVILTQDLDSSPYEQPYKDFSFVLIDTSGKTPVYKVYLTDGHKKIDGATKEELYDASDERYKLVLDDDFKEGHINSEVGAC